MDQIQQLAGAIEQGDIEWVRRPRRCRPAERFGALVAIAGPWTSTGDRATKHDSRDP